MSVMSSKSHQIAPVDLLVLHGGVLHSVVAGIDLKDYAIALHIVVIDHVARLQVLSSRTEESSRSPKISSLIK